jgi:dienelactone hydrolase
MTGLRAFLASTLLTASLAFEAGATTPPAQPRSGPGGADYVGTEVVKRGVGRASAGTFVFHAPGEPAKPRPVVVLLHAWGAVNPQSYGGFIDHLARKGYLVLFPRFQTVNRTRPADATGNAVDLVRAALDELANDREARPDRERVAFVGHLAGTGIAFNMAALAAERNLPAPKLVFAAIPGGLASDPKSRGIPLEDLSRIPASTLLVTIIGDQQHLPSDRAARRLLREAKTVDQNRKLFMRTLSDDHGFPVLSATLSSFGGAKDGYDGAAIKLPPDPPRDPKQRPPAFKWTPDVTLSGEQTVLVNQLAGAAVDTLDYLAFWKTFEFAAEAAFAGRDATTLRDNPSFVEMGRWSDGWPVKRLFAEVPKPEADRPATAATTRVPAGPTTQPVRRKKR